MDPNRRALIFLVRRLLPGGGDAPCSRRAAVASKRQQRQQGGPAATVTRHCWRGFLTAGESHGKGPRRSSRGCPPACRSRSRRSRASWPGAAWATAAGPRMRFEQDEVTLVGGVRHGRTLGSPVAIEIANTEWPKWEEEMSPGPGRTEKPLTQPRPGHADLAGMQKYGFDDARDVLERASARETAARVAAGACAKALLAQIDVQIVSHVVQLGPVVAKTGSRPVPADLARVDESPVRCFDPEAEAAMIAEVKAAAKDGDSLGGVVEVLAYGVPVGLGSHVHWDRKLDGAAGPGAHEHPGGQGRRAGRGLRRRRPPGLGGPRRRSSGMPTGGVPPPRPDRAGGIEGGMSTGELLVARAAMKPLATLNRPVLKTVDVVTKEETVSFKERTDVTAVPAMGVVAETMVALVLAGEALRKFGGDSVGRVRAQPRRLPRLPRLRRTVGAGPAHRDDGRRARPTVGRALAPGSAGRSSTATSRSSATPAGPCRRSSRPTASPRSGSWRPRRWPTPRWASVRRWS